MAAFDPRSDHVERVQYAEIVNWVLEDAFRAVVVYRVSK